MAQTSQEVCLLLGVSHEVSESSRAGCASPLADDVASAENNWTVGCATPLLYQNFWAAGCASRHCHPKAALAAAAAACVAVIFFLKSLSKFPATMVGGPPSMIFRILRVRPTLRRLERLRTRDRRT